MTSTTALIVLTTQLESHGDISSNGLDRYSGQAFTFTLRPDGYATITDPSAQPITLCPKGTGFIDTQGLCGAQELIHEPDPARKQRLVGP